MSDETTTTSGNAPHTTIIERRGSGGTVLIGLVLLVAVVVIAFFAYNYTQGQSAKDAAITDAAQSIGSTAEKAGDAIDKQAPADGN